MWLQSMRFPFEKNTKPIYTPKHSLSKKNFFHPTKQGQFFPDVHEFCEKMANEGKTVIVAALNGTFQRKPFENIPNLVASADAIDHLTAVCMLCSEPAPFSLRTTEEKEVEVIGGQDKYISVCRQCYLENTTNNEEKS